MRSGPRRPLTDRQRRTAFPAVGALVLGAAIAVGALGPSRTSHPTTGAPPAAAHSAPRIADVIGTASASATQAAPRRADASTPSNQPTAREEQLIDSQARTFLAAYLAYEVGPLDATARTELHTSATRALARRLIDHPVELPQRDRPALGEIRSVAFSGGGGGEPIAVDATIEHDGWVSRLTLQLEDADGRWLVARVT